MSRILIIPVIVISSASSIKISLIIFVALNTSSIDVVFGLCSADLIKTILLPLKSTPRNGRNMLCKFLDDEIGEMTFQYCGNLRFNGN